MKKVNKQFVLYILSLINFAVIFVGSSVYLFVSNKVSEINLEEMLFHMKAPIKGTGGNLIEGYLRSNMVSLLLIAFALIGLVFIFFHTKIRYHVRTCLCIFLVSIFIMLFGGVRLFILIDAPQYIKNQMTASKFIEENYIKPEKTNITFPKHKRNLIWIYMESMESSYASREKGGKLNENLIPELTELAENNINFSESDIMGGATSSYGTGWTTASLFAQTSGLPMLLNIGDGTYDYKKFASGAYTFGDILKSEKYVQKFMMGSDAVFGGRKSYLENHGSYEIYDYNLAKKKGDIPKNYYEWWGIEDEKLYKFAKRELQEISQKDQPFALSLLTVDTHFVGGYVCSQCHKKHKDRYLDVIHCASRQVSNFVKWIQKQKFYKNTTIVITGDHPTMDGEFVSKYYDDPQRRKVYNCIINAPIQTDHDKKREFNTFDFYPTVLSAMGVYIEGDRLGLGTNLFSGKKTLAEQYGYEKIDTEFSKTSRFYNNYIW